ncbi:GNAT family N-acetyltransferase [Denitrobaculum tricleocarpae]|uniref:GNAT family N-acetyltransferase n=1 Tax=Denitrobaculum tricleocarpae TaxID=2591009 RepID=A0A545TUN3_9PROT|nr:GNAT family N-acetyltransferase [Denitrobaculum tricleocarpae]TQV80927.1 GNAT family N-acetyltransferase [Denitrobaculum tricleocarpae]
MTLRAATAHDLPAIQEIVEHAYSPYIERMGRPPGPMLDDYVKRIEREQVSVVEVDGRVGGLLVLIDQADHLLLDNIAMHPDFQGRGLGRQLMDFAEAEALRRGFGELRLYTHESMTENIAIYSKLGWEETGRALQAGFQRVFMRKVVSQDT